ncbi:MAG TPA: response regulator [Phenylobacterium sp.]|uniref:hybrid sensor histidine kinase/response regulator n=1 Tax=Phenylobacterium sp. TaxID=1871053 RepID=UPI002B499691|nr:response regulator [Phenylobacterium sp.]HKR90545.1 response regulator [Phenylobacterium sp.]
MSWLRSAAARLRELPARLSSVLIIALAGALLSSGAAWPWIWFAAAVAVQVLVLPFAPPAQEILEGPALERDLSFSLAAAFSATSFAAGAVLLWLAGGWAGRPLAIMLLAGGAASVALKPGVSMRLLWAGCAPFVVSLLTLPLISWAMGPAAERPIMSMTALVSALFVVAVGSAIRRSVASARRLQGALQEARSERQRAEAARVEKDDFLGQMSHELRTPLNGVLGMAQAMRIDPLTPEQLDRLDVIRDSGEALRTVIDDLLDPYSSLDAELGGFTPEPEAVAELADQRLRVLAAEDNPTNQLVLKTLLGQAGIDVHVVGDGEAAVEAWRGAHWDLLLMDIRMPVMDGLQATRAIRAAETAAGRRRTPIIAVSAEASTRAASEFLSAGIDCLVPKPIQFAQLATAMAAAVEAAAGAEGRGAARR